MTDTKKLIARLRDGQPPRSMVIDTLLEEAADALESLTQRLSECDAEVERLKAVIYKERAEFLEPTAQQPDTDKPFTYYVPSTDKIRPFQGEGDIPLYTREAQPEREPLSFWQVAKAFTSRKQPTQSVDVFRSGVRFAEKHHGINAKAKQ